MSKQKNQSSSIHVGMENDSFEVESCELSLSADGKWLRLFVAGKQTAAFHVNYVNKVLGTTQNATKSENLEKSIPSATV